MNATKDELIENGWSAIGSEGELDYFGKMGADGEILYVATHKEKTLGHIRSLSVLEINLLSKFIGA